MAGVIWVIGWCLIARRVRAVPLRVTAGVDSRSSPCTTPVGMPPAACSRRWVKAGTVLAKVQYVGFFEGPIQFGSDGPA